MEMEESVRMFVLGLDRCDASFSLASAIWARGDGGVHLLLPWACQVREHLVGSVATIPNVYPIEEEWRWLGGSYLRS